MKQTLKTIAIIVLIFLSSCATQKRCALKFPQLASYDSIYIQKIDSVKIILPGDSIKIVTKVPCDNFELITQNGKLTAALKVVNGILSQRINIKPDTVTRFVTNTITKIKEITKPVEVRYVPKFVKILAWAGGISILILIALFGLKTAKFLKL